MRATRSLNRSVSCLLKSPSMPAEKTADRAPSMVAPTWALRVRLGSLWWRVPRPIWMRWMMLSMLAKIWLMIWWPGTVISSQVRMRRMARLRMALKMGIHFKEAPKVNLAVAMAQAISARSWTNWPMTIMCMYSTLARALKSSLDMVVALERAEPT